MEFEAVKLRGMLMGVASATDFETKAVIGVQLDVGYRAESGRFMTNNIKVLGAKQDDFTTFLDEVVEIQLENVSITSYLKSNRAMLSIKAQKATIL
ncbi:hypothetical protein [Streptococcus suis]|uniref:hypothetical protein n=3 Tax=Streptococcus suis TaxID=1307 RepID=UPI0003F8CD16|nr:hypothetical protein [Streptococcus suis]NQK94134.1 hypothetical protein [Streptococcus suis]HEM4323941.1 hypothetical protein [Streptococcus suis]HEM6344977.1 hypothetical protein [Streptococcus suis]